MEELKAYKNRLIHHPFLSQANTRTLDQLQRVMETHVFCVWDSMNLLKRIQSDLAPCRHPWKPRRTVSPSSVRMINEIVLGQESGLAPEGVEAGHCSHFELYLHAMEEVGADTAPVREFVESVERLSPLPLVEGMPEEAYELVGVALSIAEWGQLHEVVAAFSFGRETILPRMFRRILENLGMGRSQAPVFHYFLDRHIELDRDIHGPAAYQLLTELWAEDLDRWQEAVRAGREAIDARVRLWDAVGQAVGGMESRPHSGTVA